MYVMYKKSQKVKRWFILSCARMLDCTGETTMRDNVYLSMQIIIVL